MAGSYADSLCGTLVDFWRQTGSFVAGNQKLLAVIMWPHFWAIQIILVVLICHVLHDA